MKLNILDNIPFKLDEKLLFNRVHIDADSDEADEIRLLVESACKVGRPKGIYGECYIDSKDEDSVTIQDVVFKSRVLRVNLDNVFKVFPYCATCGQELEEWAASITGILEQYWADIIKEMALINAITVLKKHFDESINPGHVASMNPGSLEDWPISQQPELFSLLGDTRQSIGLLVMESFLLVPVKSVSGIWFQTEANYENCMLCPRKDCPGRRAPYESKLYENKFSTKT